jgi:hypothetical protein
MRTAIWLWLVLGAIGCATRVDVTTTVEPGTDFSRFESYALVPPSEAGKGIRERLEVEIAQEFEKRGYRAAPRDDTDLLVVFQGSTRAAERRTFAESPGGCCVIEDYVAGTLMIDVFDARSGERIWRGVGEVDLPNEKHLEAAASSAAAAILAEFPGGTPDTSGEGR